MASSGSGGIGFLGLLQILLIGLKLSDIITWSWWWIITPIWGGILCQILLVMSVVVYATIKNRY